MKITNKAPKITVAAITGGIEVPSARFRIRQYIGRLHAYGVDVTEFSAPLGSYPPQMRLMRPLWGIAALPARIPSIWRSYSFDLTFLQREMLSTFQTLEPLTKRPRVLDVDDAIWVHRRGQFAARLAGQCEGIICGNTFLAEQFRQWSSRVTVIPTAVDTDKYLQDFPVEVPIIGWSGTSGGFKYLYGIEPALSQVLKKLPGSRLRVVSDSFPSFQEIPVNRVEFIRWSPENEVPAIQGMAVGVMPLDNSLWEQGKCSFKMLTYMACGIPVVVSPIGMNVEVLSHGRSGLAAKSIDDWVNALLFLLQDSEQRIEMGAIGRQTVLQKYSLNVVAPKLAETLLQLAGRT
jgi:glycosyltransferase involved in cell wall biosynthesis